MLLNGLNPKRTVLGKSIYFRGIDGDIFFYYFFCVISCRIEEAKRAIKRPAEHDRYPEVERKRPTAADRRFEPPPPPRFDTSISRLVVIKTLLLLFFKLPSYK